MPVFASCDKPTSVATEDLTPVTANAGEITRRDDIPAIAAAKPIAPNACVIGVGSTGFSP